MTTLHIHLQTGFRDDTVEVAVDGEPVYRGTDITTSLLEGIAEDFEVNVEDDTHQVTVTLPDRGISSSTTIEIGQDVYLGVSVEDGELLFRVSDDPFGYL